MAKHEKESLDFTYDVFLSFRGEDTRHRFLGYLRNELRRKGINTFIDDKNLGMGEGISPALSKAIEESRIFIVVFSENYASSTWCLDELVKILECSRAKKQLVFPIFYHVDPSDIRHQRKRYGEHMIAHQNKFGKDSQKVQAWTSALSEACNFTGQHIATGSDKYEIDLIKEIVEKVYKNIAPKPIHTGENPVGLGSRIEEVKSMLEMKSGDKTVRMLGIHGLGGIGKTELAKALYDKIVRDFNAASFLADVGEKSKKINGLEDLQKTLLSEMKEELEIKLGSTTRGMSEIKRKLHQNKVLLVLDDVDDKDQLEKLAGGRDWFGKGSRIIITTRDKVVLSAHKVEEMYEMKELGEQHSLELFCWNAFKQSQPKTGYENVSLRALGYAKGLPMALKVIGSDLATLCEGSLEAWECALGEYEKTRPHKEIQDVLKISYDRLDDNTKQVFLDIACFFKGEKIEYVKKILEELDPSINLSINLLVNKSLLTIESGRLKMHDLIQYMGRKIVKKEASNPGKRSRLWDYDEVIDILTEDLGSNEIQGIMLDPPERKEVDWSGTAFKKMEELRILIIRNTFFLSEPECLPNHLRVLDWEEYPSKSFPFEFYPKKIIVFNLPRSHLSLQEPFKEFSRLIKMDFSYNQSITKIPDVSKVQNLREMRLDNCRELVTVHESVGNLERLAHLSASGCTKLRNFLQTMFLPSLEVLDLNICESLEQFPEITKEMKTRLMIYMRNTAIQKLPESIGNLIGLDSIDISNNKKLEYLPSSFFMLPNVVSIKIKGCSQIRESIKSLVQSPSEDNVRPMLQRLYFGYAGLSDRDLLAILNCFPRLEELDASGNNFVSLPACIKECVHLTSLDVSYCMKLRKIPECTNLKILDVDFCWDLREISELPSTIQKVHAKGCTELTRETSGMLWYQVRKGIRGLEMVMAAVPENEEVIPKWFDMVDNGGYPHFWVRGGARFPILALALVFEDVRGIWWPQNDRVEFVELHLVINDEYVPRKSCYNFRIRPDHILICDLQILFSDEEWLGLDAFLDQDWNLVEVLYDTTSKVLTLSCWGIFVYQEESNREDVQFMCPDPKYSCMLRTLVPKKDPKQERKKLIENYGLDQSFDTIIDILNTNEAALRENIKDLNLTQDYENLMESLSGTLRERYEEISRQAKAELESEGAGLEDKHSLLTSYLDHLNAIGEREDSTTSGPRGNKEEQGEIMWKIRYDGVTDGLVEARKSFPSLDIIKTRSVASRKHCGVAWILEFLSSETTTYINGIIDGLLEAKLSFPELNVWATVAPVLSRRGIEGLHDNPFRPSIRVMNEVKTPVDVGEASTSSHEGSEKEQKNDLHEQEIMVYIFRDGMMDGLYEAKNRFLSLNIVKTSKAASSKNFYGFKCSLEENELPSTVEMRTYTNGIINGLHEAKLSFPNLDIWATLKIVLSSIGIGIYEIQTVQVVPHIIGIYETPILEFASDILDAINMMKVDTFGLQGSKEEQLEIVRKILYDGMIDGLLEARKHFPSLDIIKTTSAAKNRGRKIEWLFLPPQGETRLYIKGIIKGLLEAKLSFPDLDMWATLDRLLCRRGMEGLSERIRPLIRVMGEASTSGHEGRVVDEDVQILWTIFNNGINDVLYEVQNRFPSLDLIKTRRAVFNAIHEGNWIELFCDQNLVLPTIEMVRYMDGIVNGLHEAKLSFPDLDKWTTLNAVLSRIGIDETLILQYAPRFRIHYKAA